MKDCKKIHPLLSPYLDGTLSSQETAQVRAHLNLCEAARGELADLRRLREVMVALPEPKPPQDLHQRIMAKVQGRPLPLPRRPVWVLPAGAMAVAAVVAVFLFVQNPGLMDFSRQKQSRFSAEQSGTMAANKPAASVAGNSNTQSGQTNPSAQTYSYAPSQPQNANAGLAKDQKAAPVPAVQLASIPRAKESRAAKKMVKNEEGATDLALAGTPAVETFGAVAAPPSAATTFGGSTTLSQAPSSADFSVNASLPTSKTNLPEAQAPVASAAVPSAAPAAEAPTPVNSWSGSFNPATTESQELVTDPAVFQKDWQSFQPGQAPPAVDFTTQAVVVLMDQERPTAGYSIRVTSLEDKPDQLVIHYQVQAPPAGSFTAQVLSRPWALQIIPKPAKPVVFQKD